MDVLQNDKINVSVFGYKPELNDQNVILYSISVTTKYNKTWILEKRFLYFWIEKVFVV